MRPSLIIPVTCESVTWLLFVHTQSAGAVRNAVLLCVNKRRLTDNTESWSGPLDPLWPGARWPFLSWMNRAYEVRTKSQLLIIHLPICKTILELINEEMSSLNPHIYFLMFSQICLRYRKLNLSFVLLGLGKFTID